MPSGCSSTNCYHVQPESPAVTCPHPYLAGHAAICREQLLQLPHNSAAFALLQDRGLHPAYKGLAQQMQAPGGASSSVAVRLAACLSQLAYWCPLFGEQPSAADKHSRLLAATSSIISGCTAESRNACVAPAAAGEAGFLPDLAFPFIKLFGPKAESVFEAVATLLLNWCQGWFELFPNPPLPLLRRFLVGVLGTCYLHSRSSTNQNTRFKDVAANSPADT